MQHLFSPGGRAALAAVMGRQPLLAFDFDGTLAPIVPRPDDARIARPLATRLQRLSQRLPVAIVSGRAVADLRGRLGFEPHYLVGNHGAEHPLDPLPARHRQLDPLRQRLAEHGELLRALGVQVEDKGLSIALHYRLSRQREAARVLIRDLLDPSDPSLRTFAGKMVENAVPAGLPDKAEAVHTLVARSGAGSAFFAGDDVNDEPVFAAAPPHWLTVRVGRDDAYSRARYFLDSPTEMGLLLDRMLELLPTTSTRP